MSNRENVSVHIQVHMQTKLLVTCTCIIIMLINLRECRIKSNNNVYRHQVSYNTKYCIVCIGRGSLNVVMVAMYK